MTWEAAMRFARIRARETGVRHRVYGYRVAGNPLLGWHVPGSWRYAVGRARGEAASVTFGGAA